MRVITYKKAFTLFSTIILIFIFSLLAIKIFQTKSTNSVNIVNQYKYIQAKNHLMFLEEYIKEKKDLEDLKKLQIENSNYEIIALIKKIEEKKYSVELIVKAIDYDVRVYKRLEITSILLD